MPRTVVDPAALRRDGAGRYATGDGRFTVEQASGGWMVSDTEHTNELGLPLVRGPFATLADARGAVESARSAPPPESALAARIAALPPDRAGRSGTRTAPSRAPSRRATPPEKPPAPAPPPPAVIVREWRPGDGEALRRLWATAGMRSIGDDDEGLALMAARNPGLVLVATVDGAVVGSALGGWDGRRGWIYHVAVAPDHRRRGIARQLVERVEGGLRAAGCRKVNVMVQDGNGEGEAFWTAAGYTPNAARQLGRELGGRGDRSHGRG